MNRLAVAEVVKAVRRRIAQGDCPTIPAYRVSTLEEVIFDLAADNEDLKRQIDSQSDRDSSGETKP